MRTLSFSSSLRPLLWAVLPLLLALAGCKNDNDKAAEQLAQLVEQHKADDEAAIVKYLSTNNITNAIRRDSGLYIVWQTQNTTGDTPVAGAQVKVRYIGRFLSDGYRFDASIDNGTPCGCTTFAVGGVIEGWNEALKLMHKGDKVTLLVPSHLAYGSTGNGSIGPFAALRFEMELLDFQNP